MVERSTTVRFCRWLFSWRGLRRMLILLPWLATLIALFHGEETWRGRRAWNKYRQELEAHGEQLNFAALVPKPVPDEQNFAATPVIKSWFEKKTANDSDHSWSDNYSRVAERVSPPKEMSAKAERRFEDLAAWETAFAVAKSGGLDSGQKFYSTNLDATMRAAAAPAVLEGLKTNEALFAELRVASLRPYSRYPVNYDVVSSFAIQLPHLRMVKGVCQRLQFKACAELASGQGGQALGLAQLGVGPVLQCGGVKLGARLGHHQVVRQHQARHLIGPAEDLQPPFIFLGAPGQSLLQLRVPTHRDGEMRAGDFQ